jgi:hypothetical protein
MFWSNVFRRIPDGIAKIHDNPRQKESAMSTGIAWMHAIKQRAKP